MVQVTKGVAEEMARREAENTITLRGKKLTPDQNSRFLNGKKVWLEGMTNKNGELFNSFIKLSEDRLSVRYSNQDIPFRIGKIDLSEEQVPLLTMVKRYIFPMWFWGVASDSTYMYSGQKIEMRFSAIVKILTRTKMKLNSRQHILRSKHSNNSRTITSNRKQAEV